MNLTEIPNNSTPGISEEGLLARITNQIRRSLELPEILTATVAEVRAFLGTDRVMVYRFDADGSGEVIAESIYQQHLPSLLGLHFPANDIPPAAREMFLWARQRSIVNVASGRIGVSPLVNPETGKALETDNLYYRAVDPCHIQYLSAMGVQSSLVVPLLYHDPTEPSAKSKLWGLLVSHHSQPRADLQQEVAIVQQVADHLAIAIAHHQMLTQTKAEQQRQAIVNRVTALLHSQSTIQLQSALEATITAFDGISGRLYIQEDTQIYTWGEQPTLPYQPENTIIEQHPLWQDWLTESQQGNIWAINDLHKEPHWEDLAPLFPSHRVRGMLIIPLIYRQNFLGILTIFRTEFDTDILWAGQRDLNELQKLPQISFAAWLEHKKQQAPEWKPEEIAMGSTLANQFAMAIQQQKMYQHLQELHRDKEIWTQENAVLKETLNWHQLFQQVSKQMHSSLDYQTTLQTIVQQVRNLLQTDRVLIYRTPSEDSPGEVIAENADAKLPSILGMGTPSECFPHEYARYYLQGRVRAVNNTASADLSPCHREFLQSLQVQANLIVPIKLGTELWGLMIAHQCYTPRNWQDAEIDLLLHLAEEAVVAIYHAQLYENTCNAKVAAQRKAQQLAQNIDHLQKAQAQLLKTEKTSSLKLWALGVAQDMKLPVSLIQRNLSHSNNYVQELLELLRLYKLHYPYPNIEIRHQAETMDVEYVIENLPKIMSAMESQIDRINATMSALRKFSKQEQTAINLVKQEPFR